MWFLMIFCFLSKGLETEIKGLLKTLRVFWVAYGLKKSLPGKNTLSSNNWRLHLNTKNDPHTLTVRLDI